MIWHEHVSLIATAAGKKLGYLFRARKYFSRYIKLRIDLLEYFSHISGAATPTTYSKLDAVQRRAIRLIGAPALTCHLQPLSHRRAVDDLLLFYRYSNGFCSSELTSIISPLSEPARCTRGTSSSHPKAVVFIHQEPNGTTAPLSPGCLGPGMDCLVMLTYSSFASTNFP
nr:unnamed protein product [Callosobruchus chinensis]